MKITITIDEGPARGPGRTAGKTREGVRATGDVLRVRQIADVLKIAPATVRDLARRGYLPEPTKVRGEFVFEAAAGRRAIAVILRKRAAVERLDLPTTRPLPRWGGRAAILEPALTTGDVARRLGVNPETVRAMVWRGEIRGAWRRGRQLLFDPDEIRFLRAANAREREAARARRTYRLPKRGA